MSDADIVALVAAYVEGDLDPVSRSHLVEKLNDSEKEKMKKYTNALSTRFQLGNQ